MSPPSSTCPQSSPASRLREQLMQVRPAPRTFGRGLPVALGAHVVPVRAAGPRATSSVLYDDDSHTAEHLRTKMRTMLFFVFSYDLCLLSVCFRCVVL